MEVYLTVQELSERIKIARQTIYNKIHKKEFILNVHYHKPTRKKILFKWSAVKQWLEGVELNSDYEDCSDIEPASILKSIKKPVIKSNINI